MDDLKEHLVSDVGQSGYPQHEGNKVEEDEIIEAAYSEVISGSEAPQELICDVESLGASELPAYVLRYIYMGHFLARWGARMWEFSVGLFMINIWPSSLLLAAVYGVVEAASIAIFGPIIGDWIDRTQYIKVLRTWLGVQNLSFIVAGAAVSALLIYHASSIGGRTSIALVILINASGAFGALASLAGAILIERDWIVAIAEGQSPGLLSQMNAVTRRIDLSCKLLAPVAAGFIMSYASVLASANFLVVWNMFSVGLEYWFLSSVCYAVPALKLKIRRETNGPKPGESVDNSHRYQKIGHLVENKDNVPVKEKFEATAWQRRLLQRCLHIPTIKAWVVYIQQDVMLAGVALAMLYFTVLSFGTLMTATLEWKGIPTYVLSLVRGVSSVVGICATLIYPIMHSHLQSLRTGTWSIWMQWCILSTCVASIWVHNQGTSAWLLMVGVAASRLGLWMFDLSVVQQMQDSVPASERGVVGGVQNSLQSFMDFMSYVMGIIVSNPEDFGLLVLASFLSVTCAAILYTFHTYRIRRHLFHFDHLMAKLGMKSFFY